MRAMPGVFSAGMSVIMCVAVFRLGAATLAVGPSRTYVCIEDAYQDAAAGDSILVYPPEGDSVYRQVALLIRKARLTILGMGARRVRLDGEGFEYSGAGSVPRAMFQFDPGSDGSTVARFEIARCANASNNGAAFRINQANDITLRDCHIHDNDMGIMSNGVLDDSSAANQMIENCLIHHNGDFDHAGYNHNLYLGGTSVAVRGCDIHSALTGHNLKSRAHLTVVEGCFIHDSPNRELDLVDGAGETDVPGSHALVSGCVIRKDPDCPGNKTVIHFGQDGSADHNGNVYLIHCTILTLFVSPVVDLSSFNAGALMRNCLIVDPAGTASSQTLVAASRNGASLDLAVGDHLWVSHGFGNPGYGTFTDVIVGDGAMVPVFVDEEAVDYRPGDIYAGIVDAAVPLSDTDFPVSLRGRVLHAFAAPLGTSRRSFVDTPDVGAYEYGADMAVRAVSRRVPGGIAAGLPRGFTLTGRAMTSGVRGGAHRRASGLCVTTGWVTAVLRE